MRQSAKFNKKRKINIDFGHTKIYLRTKKNASFVNLFCIVFSDYNFNA